MILERFERHSRWDGTQVGFDLDADSLLEEMTDDLLYHGDLNAALRRMMQQGFTDREGGHSKACARCSNTCASSGASSSTATTSAACTKRSPNGSTRSSKQEREGIDRRLDDARQSGDKRREELLEDLARDRRNQLDQLPPDLAGRVNELQQYDWMDDAARQQFEQLMDELRKQLLDSMFNQLQQGLSEISPEQLQRMKDMLAELNHMLEQRERVEEPDFEGFMERYGDFFPDNPQSLDELLEQMARQMAAMQQMLNSMTPQQRAQLQELANFVARRHGPQMAGRSAGGEPATCSRRWVGASACPFRGDEPMPLNQMSSVLDQLGDIDALEHMLRNANEPGAARGGRPRSGARPHRRRRGAFARPARFVPTPARGRRPGRAAAGRMELTAKGIRRIGQRALSDLFRRLRARSHRTPRRRRAGVGSERAETKPYEFGDPFHLDWARRSGTGSCRQGPGIPVQYLEPTTSRSTAPSSSRVRDRADARPLASMAMRGRFLAAKKVAMALHMLITHQFPRDYLGMVGFSASPRAEA